MKKKIAILHYDVPPVVGGVEAVILCHASLMLSAGMEVTLFGGRGSKDALPPGCAFQPIAEMDTQHPRIKEITSELIEGRVPASFEEMAASLERQLAPLLGGFDHVIAHNIMSTYFNLPLTIALCRLLDQEVIQDFIAWCHDISWTSTHSRAFMHPGQPWDALRTFRPDTTYVTISRSRQDDLAGSMDVQPEKITVVYNGADPAEILGLSPEGSELIGRMGVWQSDLVLLLPVRVTHAKNIEYALQVVAALKRRHCAPLLVVTGPPDPHDASVMEYFGDLKKIRAELDIEDAVRFVYESGPNPEEPHIIDTGMVSELYRVSDALLMPSHYEGFGMPVLEAGLAGMPVFATDFPSAKEIGGSDVFTFSEKDSPEKVARAIETWAEGSRVQRFRRRVRQQYTWQAIFDNDILPLLDGNHAASAASSRRRARADRQPGI